MANIESENQMCYISDIPQRMPPILESLNEQLEKLETEKKYIESRISHIKGDIETIAKLT